MIFRQLIETDSSTYTYLLGCQDTRQAILIDPVLETVERDLAALQELELTLAMAVETHIHADHVTAASRLRSLTGCRVAVPGAANVACADIAVEEGTPLEAGTVLLRPLFTPGHTDDHHSYLVTGAGGARVFTGDALLIDGCGRTDFQNGDAATLYRSVHDKIFTLPQDCLVFPAHDYEGRRVSTVAQERARNPRLGDGIALDAFVEIMAALDLPYPKRIDVAVPANRNCGATHEEPRSGAPVERCDQG